MSVGRIIQIQSGSEESGGIANYISLLVKSEKFSIFENIVTVKKINIKLIKKYDKAKLEIFDNRINYFNFINRVFAIRRLTLKHKNSLLHSHALKVGLLTAFSRLFFNSKFIYTNHGLRFKQKRKFLFLIFYLIEIFVMALSEKYICVRNVDYNFLKSKIKSNFLLKKIELIKLRLDTQKHNKKDTVFKFEPPYIILGIGSLIDIKRPDKFVLWINCLVKNGIPIKAFWLGDGPLMNEMIKLTRILKLDITWKGEVSKRTVFSYLNKASYLIQTSQFEVYPTVVIESFCCGTPVISNDYWGVDELIQDNSNGYIVKSDFLMDERKNYKLIKSFFNKSKYKILSQNCKRDFYSHFHNHKFTSNKYKKIYKNFFKI